MLKKSIGMRGQFLEFVVIPSHRYGSTRSTTYGTLAPPPPPNAGAKQLSLIPTRPRMAASLVRAAGRGLGGVSAGGPDWSPGWDGLLEVSVQASPPRAGRLGRGFHVRMVRIFSDRQSGSRTEN